MKRFDEVQFFGSHRVSDFAAWARAVNGEPRRLFGWSGSNGQVFMNFGDQTPEEAKLGLVDLTGLSPDEATDEIFRVAEEQNDEEETLVAGGLSREEAQAAVQTTCAFPDEEVVVNLAALWSIDPTQLPDLDLAPGLG